MKIYVARHGQTDWNIVNRWQGHTETSLNKNGISQAEELGNYIARYNINKIYSSPLKRAKETSQILQKKLNIDIVYKDELKEVYLKDFQGLTTNEILNSKHKDLFLEWEANPYCKTYKLESLINLQNRSFDIYEKLVLNNELDFLIVGHGTFIKCLFCKLLNIPLEKRDCFEISNTGVSIIEYDAHNKKSKILSVNNNYHII